MDVADEAFNHDQAHQNEDEEERLLQKETWRHWMQVFTSGKKLSEANIVIKKDEIT